MTCLDCGRKKWIFTETPRIGHCSALSGGSMDIADCLRIALASERNARLEAGEEVGRLRDALREILVGKVRADYEHPMGEWASMAARFLNIARAALEPEKKG